MADLLADGFEFSLTFLRPEGLRYLIRHRLGHLTGGFLDWHGTTGTWVERGRGGSRVAAGSVIEASLPLADFPLVAAETLSFIVAVVDGEGNEVERHPAHRAVEVTVPDERFEAQNWTA